MKINDTIVFVSLAANQSRFFAALDGALKKVGHRSVHICFHEGAVQELKQQGLDVYNPFEFQPEYPDQIDFDEYGIQDPALLIGHEKAAYELSDTTELVHKFKGHLAAVNAIVKKLLADNRELVFVQELGGFTSVLASYYVARMHNIDNWFIEPSFFRGRVFLTPNTFSAPKILKNERAVTDEVRQTLNDVVQNQSVVIPNKDRLHYRGAAKKLMDPKNVRRLVEKLYAKYVLKQQEEFQHIGGHVARHVRMFLNSRKLKKYYSDLKFDQPFIYYPLHVPADFALTVRSPEYLDQLALIDFICRCAPLGWKVAIKEHPALVGAIDCERAVRLLDEHDNLVLLSPTINNHKVLAASAVVVTVNSKAGAEALLYGKPVFALGDSFYKDCALVTRVHSLGELPVCLRSIRNYGPEAAEKFFQDVWDSSYSGELYELSDANVSTFAESLRQCFMKIQNAANVNF